MLESLFLEVIISKFLYNGAILSRGVVGISFLYKKIVGKMWHINLSMRNNY